MTYTELLTTLEGPSHGHFSLLRNPRDTINRAVRFVIDDIDLRSTRRKSPISPNLFNNIYDYSCPSDMKGYGLIDVVPQVNRSRDSEIVLTTAEEFDRTKSFIKNMAAFYDFDLVRRLRLSIPVDSTELIVSELDSLNSGGGIWEGYGDGYNLSLDYNDHIKGAASIDWDINLDGGTTAGIYNSNLDPFDISPFINSGSLFVWVKIVNTTNLTNFVLKVGSSSSDYFTKTITSNNEGTAFYAGWNLLRFDFSSAIEVGSVDEENCDYVALYMTKNVAKTNEQGYKFDWLVLQLGKIYDVIYYSEYGWRNSTGVWLENSLSNTDILNADAGEQELIMDKCMEFAAQEDRELQQDGVYFANKYLRDKDNYIMASPSERKLLITSYGI